MVVIHPSFTVSVATRYGRVAVTILEEQGRPIRVLIQGVSREIATEAEAMARLIGLLLRTGDNPEGVLQEVARELGDWAGLILAKIRPCRPVWRPRFAPIWRRNPAESPCSPGVSRYLRHLGRKSEQNWRIRR